MDYLILDCGNLIVIREDSVQKKSGDRHPSKIRHFEMGFLRLRNHIYVLVTKPLRSR